MRLVGFVLLVAGALADAQAEKMGRSAAALRGLPAVRVEAVVPADTDLDAAAFTSAVQASLELAGVPVALEPNAEAPILRFRLVPYVITDKEVEGACFVADLALFDTVLLSRSGKSLRAATWESASIIGVRPALDASLERVAEDLAEEFATEYLAANPRRP